MNKTKCILFSDRIIILLQDNTHVLCLWSFSALIFAVLCNIFVHVSSTIISNTCALKHVFTTYSYWMWCVEWPLTLTNITFRHDVWLVGMVISITHPRTHMIRPAFYFRWKSTWRRKNYLLWLLWMADRTWLLWLAIWSAVIWFGCRIQWPLCQLLFESIKYKIGFELSSVPFTVPAILWNASGS